MTRQEIEERKNTLASLILDREAKLREHDYVSAKIADGRASAEEYADVITQKTKWAEEVAAARGEMSRLSVAEADDDSLEFAGVIL